MIILIMFFHKRLVGNESFGRLTIVFYLNIVKYKIRKGGESI